jgi:hypothetical protein
MLLEGLKTQAFSNKLQKVKVGTRALAAVNSVLITQAQKRGK